MEKTFDLVVKDGRKVLVMMTGIELPEVMEALRKASGKIDTAKLAIIEVRELEGN